MAQYHNIMEDVVESQLDELKDTLSCCLCPQCRGDIVSLTLNQLPARYVMTQAGGVMVKIDQIRLQSLTDIRTALIKSALIVKEHPRH